MSSRRDILKSICELSISVDEAYRISPNGFDGSDAVFTLRRSHVESILRRFLAGELSPDDVERWADLVEMRDDLDYAGDDESPETEAEIDWISDTLCAISNPSINGILTKQDVLELLKSIASPRAGRPSVEQ